MSVTKTEAQTRKQIIDKKLFQAGWTVNDRTQVIEEFDIEITQPNDVRETVTPYGGHQFSDYVLLGKDGQPLAVVEAKKTSKDAELGREQAKQYCQNIQTQYGGALPFCFYDPPGKVLEKLTQLEEKISNGLFELKQMGIN